MEANSELEVLRAELNSTISVGEIKQEYGALAAHYPVRDLSDDRMERLAKDWIDDLGGLPVRAVAEACKVYRRSGQKFMATSGEIRARAIAISSAMRARALQIESAAVSSSLSSQKCQVFDGATAFSLPMPADQWRAFRKRFRDSDAGGRCWHIWAPAKINGTELVVRDRRSALAMMETSSDLLRTIGATAVVSASCRYRTEV